MTEFAERDTSMRPEHALMLYAIRAHFGHEEGLSPGAIDRIDADFLLAEAGEHGLIPLLHRQLDRLPGVPLEWRNRFKADAQRIVASNLVLGRELVAITQRFADAGIGILAFKGPAQAVQAYGDLGFRPYSDLDVLVHREEVERALLLLRDDGYETKGEAPFDGDRHEEHAYHIPCHHPEKGTLVEVHWQPVSNRFALRLDDAGYWARATSVDILGRPVPTLEREDTFLIVCAHAAKHYWERLEWAVSVAGMLAGPEPLDWATVLRRAEAGGVLRVVLTGAALAHTISGVPLPPEIAERVAADDHARALAEGVLHTTLQRSRAERPAAAEPLHAVRFHLLGRDRLRDGLRFLLTPKDTDWELLAGTRAPRVAAVGARVYRLVKRHVAEQVETSTARMRDWLDHRRR